MPIMYRAPETLLYIQWSFPVDIWSVGLTVHAALPVDVACTNRGKYSGLELA